METNAGNRFNDGKCDPEGRLWAGTMGQEDTRTPGVPEPKQGTINIRILVIFKSFYVRRMHLKMRQFLHFQMHASDVKMTIIVEFLVAVSFSIY